VPLFVNAQIDSTATDSIKTAPVVHLRLRDRATGKNIFKTNISNVSFNNYSLTYERLIAKKVSFALGYRYMPFGVIPYSKQLQDASGNNPDVNFNLFKMGNSAITPEFRVYAHKNMRGFYFSFYGRYASFDMAVPIKYTTTAMGQPVSENASFEGTITSFSGGLMLGTQQNLGKHIVLDIWIIGLHTGNSNGTLQATFSPALINAPIPPSGTNPVKSLQDAINGINATPFTVTGKVNLNPGGLTASSATLDCTGPWYGIRGLGLNLGIRF